MHSIAIVIRTNLGTEDPWKSRKSPRRVSVIANELREITVRREEISKLASRK